MLASNRNMIQVSNEDQTKVFASVLATPHAIRANEETPSTRYIYYATAVGQPRALRTWFPRDTPNGQDIIYPKRRALELAAIAKEPVIAIPDDAKQADYKTVSFAVVTPEQQVKPYAEPVVVQPAPEPAPVVLAEARPTRQLPGTASRVPLTAALGLLFLSGAIGVRVFSKRLA
jgi:hypothetical protein